LQTEAAPFIAEYIARKRLKKIGFTTPLDQLDVYRAEIFCLIDAEIDQLHAQEVKKSRGRK